MERSLTVLLPVHDVQSSLTDTVTEVLEAAADMTDRFEVVIIDDGSADATAEVAAELSRHYPQIRTVRHKRHLGQDAAIRTGLAESTGDMVFVRHYHGRVLERLHRPGKPAKPNFLGRTRQFAE